MSDSHGLLPCHLVYLKSDSWWTHGPTRRTPPTYSTVGPLLGAKRGRGSAPRQTQRLGPLRRVAAAHRKLQARFRNGLLAAAFNRHASNLLPSGHGHSCRSSHVCLWQRKPPCRTDVNEPRDSYVHVSRASVADVACTLDAVGIGSADSLSERCSGFLHAHLRQRNSRF